MMFWKKQTQTQSCVQQNTVQTIPTSNYNSKLTNGFHPFPQELVQQNKQVELQRQQTCPPLYNSSPLKLSGNLSQYSQDSDEQPDSRFLPPNFEKNIRELEVVVEETPEIELEKIKELIMLYTIEILK